MEEERKAEEETAVQRENRSDGKGVVFWGGINNRMS